MRLIILGVAIALPLAANAQESMEGRFERAFEAGSLRAYQCPGYSSAYGGQVRNLPLLAATSRKLAVAGAEKERATAKTLGCERYSASRSSVLAWEERLSVFTRGRDAEWLVASITDVSPGATGYTFDAVIKLPLKR